MIPVACYMYRCPLCSDVVAASATKVSTGIVKNGFVIRPFQPGEKIKYIESELEYIPGTINQLVASDDRNTDETTSKEDFIKEVYAIIEAEIEDRVSKVVAARVCKIHSNVDVEDTFRRLCALYPEAFVFAFYTPEYGCWAGASPELLLKGGKDKIETVALAGTRMYGCSEGWDKKNIKEQAVVSDYLMNIFKSCGLSPNIKGPYTQMAGKVEHLKSDIFAYLEGSIEDKIKFANLLSPTPALCGYPREKALEIIGTYETFNRRCYGGFCGIIKEDILEVYVNLRSAFFSNHTVLLYAGCGIMPDSNPDDEWFETERKMQTMRDGINNEI